MPDIPQTPQMIVFAGPNGSGKSIALKSFSGDVIPSLYINADDIASAKAGNR